MRSLQRALQTLKSGIYGILLNFIATFLLDSCRKINILAVFRHFNKNSCFTSLEGKS